VFLIIYTTKQWNF